jgi:hypothetical protein
MPFPSSESADVVQRQLDAYNAHDVEALVAEYADDAQQFEHPSKLLATGSQEIRERYALRFRESRPHAALVKRIVLGNKVIDHEEITSGSTNGIVKANLVAIYEVHHGKISRAWFISALLS